MKRISLTLAFLIMGCSQPAPYSQTVVGNLVRSGVPLAGVPVRLVVSPAAKNQPCSPSVSESATNQEGQFSLSALYSPRQSEQFAVLVHHHTVCVHLGSDWSPAWELTTGPAIRNISLQCVASQDNRVSCQSPNKSFNPDALKRAS